MGTLRGAYKWPKWSHFHQGRRLGGWVRTHLEVETTDAEGDILRKFPPLFLSTDDRNLFNLAHAINFLILNWLGGNWL